MKKVIKIGCIVVMLILLLVFLTECSLMYGKKSVTADSLRCFTHSIFNRCFAAEYTWISNGNYAVLNVPDTCDGYRVTTLGGYIGSGGPCPFLVILPGADATYEKEVLPDDAQIVPYHLEINIGTELREIGLIMMDDYQHIGSNQFAQVLVSVNCSEENKHFYSENGKLYRRSDDTLVDGFFYYADYADQNH